MNANSAQLEAVQTLKNRNRNQYFSEGFCSFLESDKMIGY
jgi:hypothetical protein